LHHDREQELTQGCVSDWIDHPLHFQANFGFIIRENERDLKLNQYILCDLVA